MTDIWPSDDGDSRARKLQVCNEGVIANGSSFRLTKRLPRFAMDSPCGAR
jgi:hypothetical protein